MRSHSRAPLETLGARQEGDEWKLDGHLTVRDTTVPVTLDVQAVEQGWGATSIAAADRTRGAPRAASPARMVRGG